MSFGEGREVDELREQWGQWDQWSQWDMWKSSERPRAKKKRKFRYSKQCPIAYYSNREFRDHLGFTKEHFKIVLSRIQRDLEGPQSHRKNALTPSSKLAIFLFSMKGNVLQRFGHSCQINDTCSDLLCLSNCNLGVVEPITSSKSAKAQFTGPWLKLLRP